MNPNKHLIPAVCLIFLFGCATKKDPVADKTSAKDSDSPPAKVQKSPAKTKKSDSEVVTAPKAGSKPDGKTPPAQLTGSKAEGEIVGTPSPKSKFAKLRLGMTASEVEKLIGKPTDKKPAKPKKSWIPSYFSKEAPRIETVYKREGQLIFTGTDDGTAKLIRIVVNPKESGPH
ncbi:MAG: hypothetical protein ABI479_00185 [Gallionella sp.]